MSSVGQAVAKLEQTPMIGSRYEAGVRSVRRLHLRRTHYSLYFVDREEMLQVVAVWSLYRRRGPKL